MTSKLSALIESGITAQQSRKLDVALSCYQAALTLAPEDAEVFSLLGLVLTQLNRLEEAEPLNKSCLWSRSYLSDLPDIGTASYFTDKNPLNIEAVGLIAVLFPKAPIVHIRRNPVETCFSIFKNKFSKFWPFAHSQSDIAHFYGQYAQLVSHWQHLLGDRFFTIQYEEFATNFSTMAPELIKYCGLKWEPQCLDFQSENRAISTLSSVQVREPVKVSPAVAGFYQKFTEPLLEELESAGIDLDTGALIEVV